MKNILLCAAIALCFANAALAANHPSPAAGQADVAAQMKTEGEVRKIDKAAGKITVKHGELKNLEMPAMTMVFRVQDKAVLEDIKAGDKIRFVAEKSGSQFVLTQVEVLK